MNLNTEEWKEFKFIDLFIFESGSDYSSTKAKEFPGENNFIGSSEFNNGVTVKTSLPNKRIGNCITVANNGSIGFAFYQEKDFSITGDITILRLKNYKLNENIGLFLRVLIELEKPKYSYSRKWGLNRMQKSELKLPVTEEGSPDWNFMEEYMNYINLQPKDIPKLKAPTLELKTEEWKEFKFIDLFIFESGSDYSSTKAKEFPGENNFIGSSEFNNGVTVKTSLPNKRIGNCITVANNGSIGFAFYQEKDFSITGDITILRLKNYKLNENIGLFLRVLIELEKPKYSYSRKWGLNRMQKSELKLPVTEEGSPDWNFMEEYMNYINLQ